MDVFVGTIMPVAFNIVPSGWARCDGQLLPIAQNTVLYSLLGTRFGGDGVNNFALPDLRGRTPRGNGPSLPLGSMDGVENVTLLASQMAQHSHSFTAQTAPA